MNTAFRGCVPFYFKLFAWLNIGVQTAFPLAAAFTPIMANSAKNKPLLQAQREALQQTQTYTLAEGESVASVAKKYNITPGMLRKLNQFRTFSRGFDNLRQGDELNVPITPLPEVYQGVAAPSHDDAELKKFASYASQAGSFIATRPNAGAAASMARSIASGSAGNEVQQWLNQFGTARVRLGVDKNFSLKNSQLDLMVPLYEQQDRLVLTQSSIHRTDDRMQSNLGVGYRWFTNDWMLGGNTFLDYDFSHAHARMGLGLEYWRDSVKLGVNSYHHLTSWKNSPDLKNYTARPANGWDLRAQAIMPMQPKIGGKLSWEQYYGNEVALFNKHNRQSNPRAITAGLHYTPAPLLMFSAEHRQGKSGEHDTRIGLDMNYQLGVTLQQQINPDAVSAMRTLAGSRSDFVERNNNIVLQYQQKEFIHLKTEKRVTGYGGEQKSLGVSVNSTRSLQHINWSAASLIASGGKIVQNGSDWAVILPAYQPSAQSVNTYWISAVAFDDKGNTSNVSAP